MLSPIPADLRTGSGRFAGPIFFTRIGDSHCNRIHSFLSAVCFFDNGYVGKQPLAGKSVLRSTG